MATFFITDGRSYEELISDNEFNKFLKKAGKTKKWAESWVGTDVNCINTVPSRSYTDKNNNKIDVIIVSQKDKSGSWEYERLLWCVDNSNYRVMKLVLFNLNEEKLTWEDAINMGEMS